jgi:large repetitive protein
VDVPEDLENRGRRRSDPIDRRPSGIDPHPRPLSTELGPRPRPVVTWIRKELLAVSVRGVTVRSLTRAVRTWAVVLISMLASAGFWTMGAGHSLSQGLGNGTLAGLEWWPGQASSSENLPLSTATRFLPDATVGQAGADELTSPNAQSGGQFGFSVAVSSTTVVVGAPYEAIAGATDAGRAYIYSASSGALISTLSSPNAQADGQFGFSVAINGTTVVVGAPQETASSMIHAGHVYIYRATTGALVSTLTSPNVQAEGVFGWSVASSSTEVVVGAIGETASSQPDAGRAYVFDAGTGALISTLASPEAQNSGWFGYSVAMSSTTVVVGAPYEEFAGQHQAGNSYTFSVRTGHLFATLSSPNAQPGGLFGYSVATAGARAVVGAPFEAVAGQTNAGHAYAFAATSGALIMQLTSPNTQSNGWFGWTVGTSGATVVVGAPQEAASGQSNAGHAYRFRSATGVLVSTLTSPSPQSDGLFGGWVAVSDTKTVVGAWGEAAQGQTAAGHAYIFPGLPLTLDNPNPPPPQEGQGDFGAAVAISGAVVVVGYPSGTVSGQEQAGQINIFSAGTGALLSTLDSPNPESQGQFGLSVAIVGNMVVVGAPCETTSGQSCAGRAYVFSTVTDALIATLANPNPQVDEIFGYSVAISGTTVVVGAPGATVSGQIEAGHAYTFNAETGALISTLTSPSPQTYGGFGDSVAISGTTVVVGAPGETVSGQSQAGHVYTFRATTGAPLLTLTSPNAVYAGRFGYSVAISGTTMVVGAEYETGSGQIGAGNAYTFRATTGALMSAFTTPNPHSGGGFGASVAIDDTTIVIGAPYEYSSGLQGAGNAYRFSATTNALISTIPTPNAWYYGYFGYSVAVSGTSVVVGAPGETPYGHAYVY